MMPFVSRFGFMRAAAGDESSATLTITGSTDGALTDYPMRIVVHYDSGTNSGRNIYLNGACSVDWSDIHFQTTVGADIYHWVETPIKRAVSGKGSTATFWVRIPSIGASPATTQIVLLYGGQDTHTSDGANTFTGRFFEDFDSGSNRNFVCGTDTGQSAAFCPALRRWYLFGAETGNGSLINIIQWVNIDTWETGFVNPATPIGTLAAACVWHEANQLFYIYGGRDGSTYYNTIKSFNPFTNTVTVLTETLTQTAAPAAPAIYIDDGNPRVYVFGGYAGSNTFRDTIWVHDTDAGTPLQDTGANLATASNSQGVAVGSYGKVYIFGGAYYSAGLKSLTGIYSYDPSSPSTDVSLVTTMTTRRDSVASSSNADGSVIYSFGGYDFNTATYKTAISKFIVATGVEAEVTEVMDKADDDAIAFYDATTDSIYAGPFVHSTGATNEDERKTIIYKFDPDTETLDSEPSLGTETITGWGKDGTGTAGESRFVGSSFRLRDLSATTYGMSLSAASSISENGKEIFEFGMTIPLDPATSGTNLQTYILNSSSAPLLGVRMAVSSGKVTMYGATTPDIGDIPNGELMVLGIAHDPSSNVGYGEINRGTRTASVAYANTGTPDRLRFNSATTGVDDFMAVHWVVQRPWTANEPTYSGWA